MSIVELGPEGHPTAQLLVLYLKDHGIHRDITRMLMTCWGALQPTPISYTMINAIINRHHTENETS